MKKLTDEQIYDALEKLDYEQVSDTFGDCLSDCSSKKEEWLKTANEVASLYKEEFKEIGISKFIDVENDPDAPGEFLIWTVE